jgi:hypothetical protein
MSINLMVVAVRCQPVAAAPEPPDFLVGMGLSIVGIGFPQPRRVRWIGGEMVHVHGVGVAGFVAIHLVSTTIRRRARASATRLRL